MTRADGRMTGSQGLQAVDQLVVVGNQLWVSGQVAMAGGSLLAAGVVGTDVDLDTARTCARQCAVNLLNRVHETEGGLGSIARVVKVAVYVASAPGFTEQHLVANAASEYLVETLGASGRHARVAIGVAALPLGSPVKVEAVLVVDPERRALTSSDVMAQAGASS